MLDIVFVRENPDAVEKDLIKRNDKERIESFRKLLEKDKRWRQLKRDSDELRAKRNKLTQEIQEAKAKGADVSAIISEAKEMPARIKAVDAEAEGLMKEINYTLMRLPNILHESVPVGSSSEDNVVVRSIGEAKPKPFELKHHGQLAQELGVADFERAVKISGSGFYFLKGDLALLDYALMNYAIKTLVDRGYTLVEPPLMMRRTPYEGVTDLDDFENVMYKIDGDDMYLIATSEHPMAAMYQDEIIEPQNLPIKYAGVSACFRREIGKHGLDERGLFRVHQFNKIEQFIFCRPDDSWRYHEELIQNAEDLMRDLEMPYRVVNVCTGDIGTVAAKKYDLEGYSPREDKYIELMSCSNCTAYQSARLNI
ncbi:MAG: serine--tRNA ligase, partial [Candidatus Altiarchaeota archaeon]|nr:serine--tRNA ligase [Candidatus Altiarchaeota archaeon]